MKQKIQSLILLLVTCAGGVKAVSMDSSESPFPVYIDIAINRIDEIDFAQQTYVVDFYLTQSWPAQASGLPTLDSFPSKDIEADDLDWTPVNDFVNVKEIEQLSGPYFDRQGEWIISESRHRGTFYADLNLKAFPFDHHLLFIKLEDVDADNSMLEYRYGSPLGWAPQGDTVHIPSNRIFETTLDFPEYSINDTAIFTSFLHRYETALEVQDFNQFQLAFEVRRKSGFYISKVISITIILVICGLLVYRIPPEDYADRLGYGITVLLAMIGHSFATKDMLPMVSYLTVLDIIVLSSNGLIFAILLSTVFKGWLLGKKSAALR